MFGIYTYLLLGTTAYHAIASFWEAKNESPPGRAIDLGGYSVHLYSQGKGKPTVIIEHSLGGSEGYFLIEEIAKFARVCIYDRPGYGWSDFSRKRRCSDAIVRELDMLLTKANIQPPYILVGDSFGSYNVRLYAHYFPEKVAGLVFTDGLHEKEMLNMPVIVKALKLLFLSGFVMSIFGSLLGIIRILGTIGVFEIIKPELRKFSPTQRNRIKRSFYSHRHWITMAQELWNLDCSGRQVALADNLNGLPIIDIQSQTFLKRTALTFFMPLKTVDRLRDRIHANFNSLSDKCVRISAKNSSHFVWTDEPEIIVEAVKESIDNYINLSDKPN